MFRHRFTAAIASLVIVLAPAIVLRVASGRSSSPTSVTFETTAGHHPNTELVAALREQRRAVARLRWVEAATTTTTTIVPQQPHVLEKPIIIIGSSVAVSGQCGGGLPSCCTLHIESHGDPYAVEPEHRGAPYGDPGDPWHHASGLWQFMPHTWNNFDGYSYAAAAPIAVQNEKAREVYATEGPAPWYGDHCYPGG